MTQESNTQHETPHYDVADHYLEAERLLEAAKLMTIKGYEATELVAIAQVHATLATVSIAADSHGVRNIVPAGSADMLKDKGLTADIVSSTGKDQRANLLNSVSPILGGDYDSSSWVNPAQGIDLSAAVVSKLDDLERMERGDQPFTKARSDDQEGQ